MTSKTLALAAVLAAALTAGASAAQEAELKAAMFIDSDQSLFRSVFNQFVERVNAEGEGLIEIGQVLGPAAIPPFEMANALQSGVVDLAGLPPGYYSGLVPEAEALQLATIDPAAQRENGAVDLLQELLAEKMNVRLLAQYGYDVPFHVFLNRPVEGMDDLSGMKLRSTPTYRGFFDRLGVEQLRTDRGEVYTALERGVVEGYANVASEVAPAGWDRVTKYRVDPGFYSSVVTILINLDAWNALTPEQQAVLERVAAEVETTMSAGMAADDRAAAQALADAGMEVIALPDDEAERYLDAAYDGYWEVIREVSPEATDRLRELLSE